MTDHTRRVRAATVVVLGAIVCGIVLAAAIHAQVASPATSRQIAPGSIAVALTALVPMDELRPGEKLPPVLVSFANLGGKSAYIGQVSGGGVVFSLHDKDGNQVQGMVLDSPPPAPPNYYMSRDNKKTLMQPVWRLDPGMGVVVVVTDGLRRYRNPPGEGQYTIRLPMDSIRVYSEDQVVTREDVDHRLWVEAATAKGENRPVVLNNLPIGIKKG